jgi:hypothetical protein
MARRSLSCRDWYHSTFGMVFSQRFQTRIGEGGRVRADPNLFYLRQFIVRFSKMLGC